MDIKLTDSRPSPTCVALPLWPLPPPLLLCFGGLKTSSLFSGFSKGYTAAEPVNGGRVTGSKGILSGDRLDGLPAIELVDSLPVVNDVTHRFSALYRCQNVSFLKRPYPRPIPPPNVYLHVCMCVYTVPTNLPLCYFATWTFSLYISGYD